MFAKRDKGAGMRAVVAASTIAMLMVAGHASAQEAAASEDIAAPLRAQAARQQPLSNGDDQFKSLFSNWRTLEKSSISALQSVARATDRAAIHVTPYGKFGSWGVGRFRDGCLTINDYEGPGNSKLSLAKFENGDVAVGVQNDNWSAKDGEEYPLTILIDGNSYSGVSAGREHGFSIRVPIEFERQFIAGRTIAVFLNDRLERDDIILIHTLR